MFFKYLVLLFATFYSTLTNVSINVHEDCGVVSEWLKCLDHCEDHDLRRAGRTMWESHSCSAKCAEEYEDAFNNQTELPLNPKFNTDKEKCLRRCWCDNTDTRFGLKGTPCHLACRWT